MMLKNATQLLMNKLLNMSLNLETKETHWYVDENSVMRMKCDVDDNKHDSIEQTYHAVCAYGDQRLANSVIRCLRWAPPKRYPSAYAGMKPMSRDHIIYGLCAIIEWNDSFFDKDWVGSFVPKFIFDKGAGSYMNLQMYFWTKLIQEKKIGWLFYPIALGQAIKNSLWNRLLNNFFGVRTREWDAELSAMYASIYHNKTKSSMYYPVYAMKLVGTMMMYVRNNWFTKQIRKQLLKITPDKNYALRIMFGDATVTEKQVKSFRSINHPRWSNFINPFRNDTQFRYLTEKETEFNNLDYDYLQWLWSKREQFIQL